MDGGALRTTLAPTLPLGVHVVDIEAIDRHLVACDGFSDVVAEVGGRWSWPSPCPKWDAHGVVEHVIGFHDVLLLGPVGAKPKRPEGHPAPRWEVTVPAVTSVLLDAVDGIVLSVPDGSIMDLAKLLPMLTTDVLVHTWDLASAIGTPVSLDAELCVDAYEGAHRNVDKMQASGMFAPPVPVPDDADPASKLVALFGRDPDWQAP
jgi:uncharacterized protein (TIGR03086 family)